MSKAPDEPQDDIPFTPVPVRARRDGWTEARQRGFIRALARIGSVGTAARTVGKTRRGAYKLRLHPGGASFAAAWDMAVERGFQNLNDHVIDRALHGAVVPRFHAGRQVGVVHRFYDKLALSVLSGRGIDLATRIRDIEQRAAYKAYFEVERAWRRTYDDLKEEQDRRMAAEAKLARLAEWGVIDPLWAAPPPPSARPAPAPDEEDDDDHLDPSRRRSSGPRDRSL